ncbi:hypothetical protein ScPMuIL_015663 [Solemya velum]
MSSKQEIKDLETDVELLLECLRYQKDNMSATKQGLLTLSTILANHDTIKDYFRETGGLDFVLVLFDHFKIHRGEGARHVLSRQCCREKCSFSEDFDEKENIRLPAKDLVGPRLWDKAQAYSIFLFLSCLVSNSGTGQTMARETGCLRDLMKIFRTSLPKALPLEGKGSEGWFEELEKTDLALWSSVTSAMSMCVNNPQNVDNQETCVSVLPFALQLLQKHRDQRVCRPVLSFIGLTVANNENNQDRLEKCGGLEILVTCLEELIGGEAPTPTELSLAVCVTSTLDSCISDNENNISRFGDLGAISLLVKILSFPEFCEQDRLRIILTIGHTVDHSKSNQAMISGGPGLSCLIQQLTKTEDEELTKAVKYVLHTCVNNSSDKCSPDLEKADSRARDNEKETNDCSNKKCDNNDNPILERISQLTAQLKMLEEQYPSDRSGTSSPAEPPVHRGAQTLSVQPVLNTQHGSKPELEITAKKVPMTPTERCLLAELSKEKEERKKLESFTHSLREDIDRTKVHMENIEKHYLSEERFSLEALKSKLLKENLNKMQTDNTRDILTQEKRSLQTHTNIPNAILNNLNNNNEGCYIPINKNSDVQTIQNSVFIPINQPNGTPLQHANNCFQTNRSSHLGHKSGWMNGPVSDISSHHLYNLDLQAQKKSSMIPTEAFLEKPNNLSTSEKNYVQTNLTSRIIDNNLVQPMYHGSSIQETGYGGDKNESDPRTDDIDSPQPLDMTTKTRNVQRLSGLNLGQRNLSRSPVNFVSINGSEIGNISTGKNSSLVHNPRAKCDEQAKVVQVEKYKKNIDVNAVFIKPLVPPIYKTPRPATSLSKYSVSPYRGPSMRDKDIVSKVSKNLSCSLLNKSGEGLEKPDFEKVSMCDVQSEFDCDLFKAAQSSRTSSAIGVNRGSQKWLTPSQQKIGKSVSSKSLTQSNCRMVKRKIEEFLENDLEVYSDSEVSGMDQSTDSNVSDDDSFSGNKSIQTSSSPDCEERKLHNKRCPGCVAPVELSGQLLNSRIYNISLETSAYTCGPHRQIREIERQHIQRVRQSMGRKESAVGRVRKLVMNRKSQVASVQKTGLSVYDFTVSSESELEGKLSPPQISSDRLDEQCNRHDLKKLKTLRRQRVKYTDEEINNLKKGVERFGTRWNQILCTYVFHSSRTAVDLKDKYKRMQMQEHGNGCGEKKQGKPRRPFSMCEIRRLKRGVKQYGYNWRTILNCYPFWKGRNSHELRNKWRSMHKKTDISG